MDENEKYRDATLDTDDSGTKKTSVQEKVAKMDDATWNRWQRGIGVVLGVCATLALYWENITGIRTTSSSGSYSPSFIIALLIALLVPNFLERYVHRRLQKARTAMIITLVVCILLYAVIMIGSGRLQLAAAS